MAWETLNSDDVLSEFTPNEAAAIRSLQGGSGSGRPFTNIDVIVARTIDEVRGFIVAGGYAVDEEDDSTLPRSLFADGIAFARWRLLIAAPQLRQLQTEERKKAFDDALAKLNKVAAGEFSIEPPIPPITTITSAGSWNSETKLIMRTHDSYANPDAPAET
jgi:hypothetical protein